MSSGFIGLPVVGGGPVDQTIIMDSPNAVAGGAVYSGLILKQNKLFYAKTTVDVSTDTTKVDLTVLNFAALANTQYLLYYSLLITSDGQPTIRFKPSYPASINYAYTGLAGAQGAGNAQTTQPPSNGTQTGQWIGTQADGQDTVPVWLNVSTGASAGNIIMGFSSHAGTFGRVKAGSSVSVMTLA